MPKWPKNFWEQKILKKVVGSFVYLWNTNNLTLPSTQVVLTCEAGIKASHVLDIYECLGFKGEKDSIPVSHCLLLARYYIYCCKFKNVSPSIREYVQQLKYNLEIEKQISTVTDSQNKFQQKWCKILHALELLYSLRAGSKCKPARRLYFTLLTLILSLWKSSLLNAVPLGFFPQALTFI